jgi:hypothetical protein
MNTEKTFVSRRARIDKMVPVELAIRNAIMMIEEIGADVRLTRAQVLISEAQQLVSDFVDDAQACIG